MNLDNLQRDYEELLAFWNTAKLISPLLLTIAGGMASSAVYYIREISKSMKEVGTSLARIETTLEHHAETIHQHSRRLEKIEALPKNQRQGDDS